MPDATTRLLKFFDWVRERGLTNLAAEFTDSAAEAETVMDAARSRFEEMVPTMAYRDTPDHPMASSMTFCTIQLALFLTLRDRGVAVHDFGSAMLASLAKQQRKRKEGVGMMPSAALEALQEAAKASQENPGEGEFVFEVLDAEPGKHWAMNITSCGICKAYSKHDAMDLVPYMCASDDVDSDQNDDGLRRTGTIGLGAHQCDFRYEAGGDALAVATQYPERIHVRSTS